MTYQKPWSPLLLFTFLTRIYSMQYLIIATQDMQLEEKEG